jgi:hypothetical protein
MCPKGSQQCALTSPEPKLNGGARALNWIGSDYFSSSNAHPPAFSTNMADPRCGAIAFAAELMAGRHLTWAELGACRASTVGIGTRRFVFKLSASPVIRLKS